MKRVYFLLEILIFSFAFCFIISCSDSTPVISAVSSSVVLEFNDETSAPSSRISVFAEANEIQRVEQMRAVNETTGLEWNIAEPRKIGGKNGRNWAGCTKLVPASGSTIPLGRYDLFYTDAAERECSADFYVSYPVDFLEKKATDFPAAIKTSYTENVALYTVEGSLIFYGKKKSSWSSNEMILRDFMLADTVRICYGISNDSVIVIMPKTKLRQNTENAK